MRQRAVKSLFGMGLLFLVLLFASGCPIMMPFMMGGMMGAGGVGHGLTKGDDPFGKTLEALLGEAVDGVFEVRGPYETIILDQTGVSGAPITTAAFRESLLKRLRSEHAWKVLDEPGRRGEDLPEGRPGSTALLSGELLQEGHDLRLVVRLVDARTANPYWSGTFSKSMETAGS
jgi:hypothetical protein